MRKGIVVLIFKEKKEILLFFPVIQNVILESLETLLKHILKRFINIMKK
jgi:hypothetical protein